MMPARDSRPVAATPYARVERVRPLPPVQPRVDFNLPVALPGLRRPTVQATIFTPAGRRVTGGLAEVAPTLEGGWTALVRSLDRPGAVASMSFSEGLRDVVVHFGDGRTATARITGTSFLANSERICRLAGDEPLA